MNGAYLHLVVNHVPVFGALVGLGLLIYALARKSPEVQKVSLGIICLTGIAGIVAFMTGDPAEEAIRSQPWFSDAILDSHHDMALVALIASILGGVVALVTLVVCHRRKAMVGWLVGLTLAVTAATALLMGLAADRGAMIRHAEIRSGAAPVQPAPEATRATANDSH
jgi:uncharacterized membrane protein